MRSRRWWALEIGMWLGIGVSLGACAPRSPGARDPSPVTDPPTRAPARAARGRLVAGAQHSCFIGGAGTVRCWGDHRFGQLGDGRDAPHRSFPAPVAGLSDAVQLAAGSTHTCARRDDGSVLCWGDDGVRSGASVTAIRSRAPRPIAGIREAVDLAGGDEHTCVATASGSVWCWGANEDGQVERGAASHVSEPREVAIVDAVQVATGATHSCALTQGGRVRCWGARRERDPDAPVWQVPVKGAVAIVAAGSFTCARQRGGRAHCWDHVDPRPGSTETLSVPVGLHVERDTPPVAELEGVVQLAASPSLLCAIRTGGEVACWGSRPVADGRASLRRIPELKDAVSITVGGAHACALETDGEVRCWGRNEVGQLGLGFTPRANGPVLVPIADVVSLASHRSLTCAARGDQRVLCWGYDHGSPPSIWGDGEMREIPQRVDASLHRALRGARELAIDGGRIVKIADSGIELDPPQPLAPAIRDAVELAGDCVRRASGEVLCRVDVAPVPVGISDATALAIGQGSWCALRASGEVSCFTHEQVDRAAKGVTTIPDPVANLSDAVQLVGGEHHLCARRRGGGVTCWGANGMGALGGHTRYSHDQRVEVAIGDAIQLAAGSHHTCAVRQSGTITCWGRNYYGELGRLDAGFGAEHLPVTSRARGYTPVDVPSVPKAQQIACGDDHTCARFEDDTVRCWGRNESGELGNGDRVESAVPLLVPGLD